MKVNATRMEFLKLKNRIKIAKKGHRLLKEKRDELMKNFLSIRKETLEKRSETLDYLTKALKGFSLSKITSLESDLSAAMMFPSKTARSQVRYKNVAGLEIPLVEVEIEDNKLQSYSLANTPSELDDAVLNGGEALKRIWELANLETELYSLATEIEKVRRRVNALEHIFIPRLESAAKYIKMRLYEMELENIINIMKIKNLSR